VIFASGFTAYGLWRIVVLLTRSSPRWFLPVIILLAVDASVLGEARELGLQRQFTLAALEAAQVPLLVHGQQVVPVRDLPAAAGTQGGLLRAHGGQRLGQGERGEGSATDPWTHSWRNATYI